MNIKGVFFCYKYAAMQLIKQGKGGRIVGATSIVGKRGTSTLALSRAAPLTGLVQGRGDNRCIARRSSPFAA